MRLWEQDQPLAFTAISERVRVLFTALGYRTIVDVVADTDGRVGSTQFSNWAVGSSRPGIDTAIYLRFRFGITLDWLYCGDASGLSLALANRLRETHQLVQAGDLRLIGTARGPRPKG
ncbi:hypothetical protein ACFOGJ_16100 [Marinibaculum pumilum]|uniref:XRE family transcriptional regulator n=1 Tax=Marinibaculum pumilum TaxID=1766165 RepID=A0ABV7L3A8_9PROT